MKLLIHTVLAALLLTTSTSQEAIPKVKVQFGKGTSSKSMKGRIQGNRSIDYVVGTAAGQKMKVTLRTSNKANYFNVIPPNETDTAVYIGSTSGNVYEGILPSGGDYKIRVYLMRSAARRNEIANFTLSISVTGIGH